MKKIILLGLLFFVVLVRLPFIVDGVIPFSFDHGKDSLAIMHMLIHYSPKLIGPWTSIPGLFFGPGWYYLLAPYYLLGGFHPASPVVAMVLLVAIQVIISKKYLGWYEAILISSAPIWMIISTSAWNPFPMTFITLGIVVILTKIREAVSFKQAGLLGFAIGMGFHFSSAFAIFYPFVIAGIFMLRKIKVRAKPLLFGICSMLVPFLPQIVFEMRHGYGQTKAIWQFLSTGGDKSKDFQQFSHVFTATIGELKLAFMPDLRGVPAVFQSMIFVGLSLLLLIGLFRLFAHPGKNMIQAKLEFAEGLIWLGIPLIGLSFLHFNIWYVLPLAPVAVRLVAHCLRSLPKQYAFLYLFIILITPITMVFNYWSVNKDILTQSRSMLPVKLEAINYIRNESAEKPFASYHYVPDIYDFSYQYLYFWQAYQGLALPTEFAYAPNLPSYITEKADLLTRFNHQESKPELIFYIVEAPESHELLDRWWGDQKYGHIIEEKIISPELTVYKALPQQTD